MKVAELLERRRRNWQELEMLCLQMETRRRRHVKSAGVTRFATLYRSACADLALADAYQLPPNTVQYLHRLVGRCHNQLYRTRSFDISSWMQKLLFDVPQRIFRDRCVQLMFVVFWSIFIASAVFARNSMEYAESMCGRAMLEKLESDFSKPIGGRDSRVNFLMAGYYIQHNTSIGLKCFAGGLLIIPGLFYTLFNSAFLGGSFGYMARPEVASGQNFFHFVTAHGPFELTAIVLSAGAGLRLGVSLMSTHGLTRASSLKKTATETMPLMGAAMILFFLAALVEGFISPSSLPYWVKQTVAVLSSGMLAFYFVFLGLPRRSLNAA